MKDNGTTGRSLAHGSGSARARSEVQCLARCVGIPCGHLASPPSASPAAAGAVGQGDCPQPALFPRPRSWTSSGRRNHVQDGAPSLMLGPSFSRTSQGIKEWEGLKCPEWVSGMGSVLPCYYLSCFHAIISFGPHDNSVRSSGSYSHLYR